MFSEYKKVKDEVPGFLKGFFINIVYKPNHNFDEQKRVIGLAEKDLDKMKDFIQISKYNSALAMQESISININKTSVIISEDSKVKREIDYFAVIFWLIILVAAIIITLKYIKDKDTRGFINQNGWV